ncbi:MAG TPA: nuclear transport factor 2 family protein [Streptosporangiaceae bacterium]|nr:nuclear transport factor 2 family protein [Streptosporangiaceae bacterium]
MAELTEAEAAILVARHVSAFNTAVATGNFADFLCLFTDDAVIRFENVPGTGELEYAGRDAYSQAYAARPPDDKIDITANARADGDQAIVPFAWKRDGATGTLRLTYTSGAGDDLDERLVRAMTVTFG